MIYRVTHTTTYDYASDITAAYNQARLAPRHGSRQTRRSFDLQIDPAPDDTHSFSDYFGNRTDHFSIHQPHRRLVVTAVSEVEVHEREADGPLASTITWEDAVHQLATAKVAADLEARQFVLDSPMVTVSPELAAYAEPSFTPGRPLVEAVLDLTGRITTEFRYQPGSTTTSTRLDEVLAQRRGVCQDFAHLLIGCLRATGLAARYVSGYLETEAPAGQEKLRGVDASHAWTSVYVPGSGWLELDPTNNRVPAERHIITAWGRDYADVSPLKGVLFSGGGGHHLDVSVDVTRLAEADAGSPGSSS
jgi:transglutaminase-like putative cysteine protease